MALESKPTITGWDTGATTCDRFLESEGIPIMKTRVEEKCRGCRFAVSDQRN